MEGHKRVVIIDDDEDDFLLLRSGFQTFATGIDLIWFDFPQAFLSAQSWRHQPIHLLILDLYLGPETGKRWQQAFLEHECCQHVPIVIYSGSEAPGERKEMIELGAADFIDKASAIDQMKNVVACIRAQLN